jgi:outer membrane protein, multidrug efflux system
LNFDPNFIMHARAKVGHGGLIHRATLISACMIFLSACGTSGRWSPSKGGAVASTEPATSADLAQWWKRFHDPVLSQLISVSLQNSPTIHSALSKVSEYRARRGVEKSALFPELTASGSGSESRSRSRDTHRTTTSENYGLALDASWQVDLFGRQRQLVRAASADLWQTKENFHAAQVTLAADVATVYVTLRSAEAQLLVVRRSLTTRDETVQLTSWREQSGNGNALETQQAITTLEQARTAIPGLQLVITQSRNQLALLSGNSPGAFDVVLAKSRTVPLMSADHAIEIPADFLRQRPDIRAAEAAVTAAIARTKSAERERYPSFNLTGSIGVAGLNAEHLFSPETTLAQVAGGLTAPIFNAGRIRNKILIQTEQERQAFIAYEATVLQSLAEVENALAAVHRYAEQAQTVAQSIVAAREATKLSALQYKAGQVDLLVSLDAQRTLLTLEQQQVTTSAQRATASIQLYKALGGGWSKH